MCAQDQRQQQAGYYAAIFDRVNDIVLCCIYALLIDSQVNITILQFDYRSDDEPRKSDQKRNSYHRYFSVLGLNILLSGLYPAYLLSAFKPVEVLYNRNKQIGLMRLSKIMVVANSSHIFLTMSMMVYYLQMNFIQKKHLGYEPGYVIRSQISGDRKYEWYSGYWKIEVTKDPSFEGIFFGGEFGSGNTVEIKIADQKILAAIQSIDEQYLRVMGTGCNQR